jgi:U3 small nucleolar RNA-associated protein 21
VLAVGYSTGEIHLHNIYTDTPLLTLNQNQFAASSQLKGVSSLSFCTDPFVGAEKANKEEGAGRILAVGHCDGYVTLWNLEKRRVFGDIRNAHEPSPQGIHVQWLSGQNVLVTSGVDNSLKVRRAMLTRLVNAEAWIGMGIRLASFYPATPASFS